MSPGQRRNWLRRSRAGHVLGSIGTRLEPAAPLRDRMYATRASIQAINALTFEVDLSAGPINLATEFTISHKRRLLRETSPQPFQE